MLLSYYQLEHFTSLTFLLLLAEKIPCFLLKGISLAANYPVSEYRKLGDLNLYINEKEAFSRACRILEAHGCVEEPEDSDHHVTYRYTFPDTHRSFTLELHYRIVGVYQFARANELVDEIFSADHLKASSLTLYGQSYPVLPPTENVFYMLHHMLKHYLYSGFGSRLLCDFTLYLKKYAPEVDFEKIHFWCRESKIFHLYELILESCRIYFGLHPLLTRRYTAPPPTVLYFSRKFSRMAISAVTWKRKSSAAVLISTPVSSPGSRKALFR